LKHKLGGTQHEKGQLEDALAIQAKQQAQMEAEPAKAATRPCQLEVMLVLATGNRL